MSLPLSATAVILAEMAPTIARWFSQSDDSLSSTQMVAAKVVDLAKKVANTKEASEAVKKIQEDPKLLLTFQKMIAKLDHDMERAFLQDREGARHRDSALAAVGRYNYRADIMVCAAALGLIACLVALALYQSKLPGEAVGIISTIAGIFGACLKDAYAFEFGSSRGSKTKDFAFMLEKIRG
ncbi:MAG: hypothetical protein J0H12_07610 [Candidatus Paracaedimonas acanthamoebae]|uniref:Uncharacterized protein n=1 Tax=Candidatus Paracaedimonas acanthamoebae TaxID=244581 RepID=A0A8J7PXZ2_9PROT|nr:hypothetical protein [Candidatus Paracaedimonas acanthamoebae]